MISSLLVSRLRWARHIQRMSEESVTKRAGKTEEGDRRRRGRLTFRWRDRVKRDIERAEVNSQEWERMEDCDGWRRLVERAQEATGEKILLVDM